MNEAIEQAERGKWTSASAAQADLLCKGRHNACKGIPDEPSTDASFGDVVHAACAAAVKGTPMPPMTVEQQSVMESCLEIEQAVVSKYFGPGVKVQAVVEKRYWIQWPDGLRHSAQVDRFHRAGAKGLIIEFKSLPGDVPDSPSNLQLRDQVCVVDMNVALLKEIATVVIQPLVTHSPEICVYQKEHITKARDELYYRVQASNAINSPRTAGEVQCKFCKARSRCPEYQTFSTSMVKVERSLVEIPIIEWTPEQCAKFCDSFDVAQRWLNEAWRIMEKLVAADPTAVPGYALQDGVPRSSIINLQNVFDRFSKSGGKLEDFMKCATISKKDLAELTRAVTALKGKKLDDKVKSIIGEDFEMSTPKQSLIKKIP